jgi:hypothetical protein
MRLRRVDARLLDATIYLDRTLDMASRVARRDITCRRVILWCRKGKMSSGRASWWRLHVTLGTDRTDREGVILHEVAHLMPGSTHHDKGYYRNLFRLARRMGYDIEVLTEREKRYKPRVVGSITKIRRED